MLSNETESKACNISSGETSTIEVIHVPCGSKNSRSCCRKLRLHSENTDFSYKYSCFHENISGITTGPISTGQKHII